MNLSSRTLCSGVALLALSVGAVLIAAMVFLSGCVAGGGGGYVDTDVYYGVDDNRPWFHDGVWLNGSRGYHESHHYNNGGDVYINPPRVRRAPTPEHRETTHSAPAPHAAPPSRPSGHEPDRQH